MIPLIFNRIINDKKSCHFVLTKIVVNDILIMTRKVVIITNDVDKTK